MREYMVFIGKEFMEIIRTKRLFVLACVFLLFAFTSPLLARYMMEFLVALMPAGEAEAFAAFMPDPRWEDGYIQFYGNISQIGMIAVLLLFMGVVLDEKRKGTAPLMLMKGLSHTGFIMAKFTVMGAAAVVIMLISVLVAHLYTYALFGYAAEIAPLIFGFLTYCTLILLMVAVAIFCSTIAKSVAMSAILGFAFFVVFGIITVLPRIGQYSPGVLFGSMPVEVTVGATPDTLLVTLLVTVALTVVLLAASVNILKRKEI